MTCGACCRGAYDAVLVEPGARIITRHPELVVLRHGAHELARTDGRCAALDGGDGGPFACRVYDDRPATCIDFTLGGSHCLTARRRVGLSFGTARPPL
jgi:Fe-S-cluster containining protein